VKHPSHRPPTREGVHARKTLRDQPTVEPSHHAAGQFSSSGPGAPAVKVAVLPTNVPLPKKSQGETQAADPKLLSIGELKAQKKLEEKQKKEEEKKKKAEESKKKKEEEKRKKEELKRVKAEEKRKKIEEKKKVDEEKRRKHEEEKKKKTEEERDKKATRRKTNAEGSHPEVTKKSPETQEITTN